MTNIPNNRASNITAAAKNATARPAKAGQPQTIKDYINVMQ